MAGLAFFFAAKPPPLCIPPWGRGTASAVDRVLSQTAHLRRSSSLFFIPLEPYPARSARHLPHAGKALFRGQRFPHPTSAPSGHLLPEEGGSVHASPFLWKGLPSAARRGWLPFLRRSRLLFAFPIGKGVVSRKAVSPYRSLPHWGRGTAPAVDRVLSLTAYLRRYSPLIFHTASTLSGSLRSPPSPRGEGFVRRYSFSTHACIRSDNARIAPSSYRSLPKV